MSLLKSPLKSFVEAATPKSPTDTFRFGNVLQGDGVAVAEVDEGMGAVRTGWRGARENVAKRVDARERRHVDLVVGPASSEVGEDVGTAAGRVNEAIVARTASERVATGAAV